MMQELNLFSRVQPSEFTPAYSINFQLGQLYKRSKDYKKALDSFIAVLSMQLEIPELKATVHLYIGQLLVLMGDEEQALYHLLIAKDYVEDQRIESDLFIAVYTELGVIIY